MWTTIYVCTNNKDKSVEIITNKQALPLGCPLSFGHWWTVNSCLLWFIYIYKIGWNGLRLQFRYSRCLRWINVCICVHQSLPLIRTAIAYHASRHACPTIVKHLLTIQPLLARKYDRNFIWPNELQPVENKYWFWKRSLHHLNICVLSVYKFAHGLIVVWSYNILNHCISYPMKHLLFSIISLAVIPL